MAIQKRARRGSTAAMAAGLVFGLVAVLVLAACGSPSGVQYSGAGRVVGWLEEAVILPAGLTMTAKMDTGTNIASIYAHDIRQYSVDGQRWVRFTVKEGVREEVFRSRVQRTLRVRRADAPVVERLVVHLGMCIAGYNTNMEVGLADRTGMNQGLLIGRKFMASVGLAVDPGATFVAKPDCAAAPNVEQPYPPPFEPGAM